MNEDNIDTVVDKLTGRERDPRQLEFEFMAKKTKRDWLSHG